MTDVKLYLGDCLEVMRGMPDKSVDAVITDPPYGIGIDGSKESVRDGIQIRKRREQEPAGEPIVPPVEVTAALQPVKVWFEKGNKWQFSDGERTFNADVQDEEFLDQVISGQQRFGHGDVLVTQLRYETVQTPVGLQTNYTVLKVHQVIQAPRQPSLFEESEPKGTD